MRAINPATVSRRLLAGILIALVAGIAIGYVDSRPGWDDTGITAVALLVAGGVAAFVAGRAPILIAILTGMWVPILEMAAIASGGPLLALAFAAAGAAIGWLVGRR